MTKVTRGAEKKTAARGPPSEGGEVWDGLLGFHVLAVHIEAVGLVGERAALGRFRLHQVLVGIHRTGVAGQAAVDLRHLRLHRAAEHAVDADRRNRHERDDDDVLRHALAALLLAADDTLTEIDAGHDVILRWCVWVKSRAPRSCWDASSAIFSSAPID